jgi:hypothetical protein
MMSWFDIPDEDLVKIEELESRCAPTAGRPARSYAAGSLLAESAQDTRVVSSRFGTRMLLRKRPHVVVVHAMKANRRMSKGQIASLLRKRFTPGHNAATHSRDNDSAN